MRSQRGNVPLGVAIILSSVVATLTYILASKAKQDLAAQSLDAAGAVLREANQSALNVAQLLMQPLTGCDRYNNAACTDTSHGSSAAQVPLLYAEPFISNSPNQLLLPVKGQASGTINASNWTYTNGNLIVNSPDPSLLRAQDLATVFSNGQFPHGATIQTIVSQVPPQYQPPRPWPGSFPPLLHQIPVTATTTLYVTPGQGMAQQTRTFKSSALLSVSTPPTPDCQITVDPPSSPGALLAINTPVTATVSVQGVTQSVWITDNNGNGPAALPAAAASITNSLMGGFKVSRGTAANNGYTWDGDPAVDTFNIYAVAYSPDGKMRNCGSASVFYQPPKCSCYVDSWDASGNCAVGDCNWAWALTIGLPYGSVVCQMATVNTLGLNYADAIRQDPPSCVPYVVGIRNVTPGDNGCFDPSVNILMADGGRRTAGNVAVGDSIWDPIANAPRKVLHVIAGPETKPLVRVGFDDAQLLVSETHPVWTPSGLKEAKDLGLTDQVADGSGAFHALTTLERPSVQSGQMVYNFELELAAGEPGPAFLVADGIVTGDLRAQRQLESRDGTKEGAAWEPSKN